MVTGGEMVHLAVAGVPGVVVITYALMRLADRIIFLIGLWMVLRRTRDEDRVKAIVAYKDNPKRPR